MFIKSTKAFHVSKVLSLYLFLKSEPTGNLLSSSLHWCGSMRHLGGEVWRENPLNQTSTSLLADLASKLLIFGIDLSGLVWIFGIHLSGFVWIFGFHLSGEKTLSTRRPPVSCRIWQTSYLFLALICLDLSGFLAMICLERKPSLPGEHLSLVGSGKQAIDFG